MLPSLTFELQDKYVETNPQLLDFREKQYMIHKYKMSQIASTDQALKDAKLISLQIKKNRERSGLFRTNWARYQNSSGWIPIKPDSSADQG